MRYLIIGPVPPPLGGISVYVDRRSRQLRDEGHTVRNMDVAKSSVIGRFVALVKIVLDPRPTRYELHAYDFAAMTALLARPFSKKITYMDHNTLLYDHELSGLRKSVLGKFMSVAHVAFVSEAGLEFYRTRGFAFSSSEVKTAYLHPPLEDESRIMGTYDPSMTEFLETANPLIVANASQLVFIGGVDLYGLDMCAELLIRIRERHPQAGFLFALADDRRNPEYLRGILEKLSEAGAGKYFQILSGQRELWPVFRRAQLMVRPTTGDGFAVSVAEALELGCPVVASDAVARPAEAVLFRNRDMDDFLDKSLSVLADSCDRRRA